MQQMIGASALTLASPVIMPTLSAPKIVAQREELLRHQRLDRRGVEGACGLSASAAKCAPVATRLLPEPVGVVRITFAPETTSISASSWCG